MRVKVFFENDKVQYENSNFTQMYTTFNEVESYELVEGFWLIQFQSGSTTYVNSKYVTLLEVEPS